MLSQRNTFWAKVYFSRWSCWTSLWLRTALKVKLKIRLIEQTDLAWVRCFASQLSHFFYSFSFPSSFNCHLDVSVTPLPSKTDLSTSPARADLHLPLDPLISINLNTTAPQPPRWLNSKILSCIFLYLFSDSTGHQALWNFLWNIFMVIISSAVYVCSFTASMVPSSEWGTIFNDTITLQRGKVVRAAMTSHRNHSQDPNLGLYEFYCHDLSSSHGAPLWLFLPLHFPSTILWDVSISWKLLLPFSPESNLSLFWNTAVLMMWPQWKKTKTNNPSRAHP